MGATHDNANVAADRGAPFAQTMVPLVAATVVGVGQTYTVIPLLGEMSHSLDSSTAATAWMATAFSLAYAGGFLVVGPAADRFGPKRILVPGLVAAAFATGAVALAGSLSVAICLRVVQGLAAATIAPTSFAYVADQIGSRRRSAALTIIVSAGLAAAVLMQILAQLLSGLGWRAVFVVSGLALLVIAGLAGAWLRPDAGHRAGGMITALSALPRLLVRPRLALLYASAATLLDAFVVLYSGLELAGPEAIAGRDGALLALRASALPAVVAAPFIALALASLHPRHRAVGALVVAALAAAVAGVVSSNVAALAICLLVVVGGIAIAAPAMIELIQDGARDAVGAGTALYTCSLFIGTSVGPGIAVALADSGFVAVALVSAGVLGCGAALVGVASRS